MFRSNFISKSEKDLFQETKDLFEFIDKQKNLQLGMISLIKGIETTCPKNTRTSQELSSTLTLLTTELKNSINSQNCIQADLSEVVRSISMTVTPLKTETIPNMCNKEVLCDGLDFIEMETERTIPILDSKQRLCPSEDICQELPEEISCTEIATTNRSFEDYKFKCRKNNLSKIGCISTLRSDFKEISKPSIYIYVVENICRKIYKENEEWSEPFYTSHVGYRMAVKLGFSCKYIGIYVKLVKGEFDDLLSWPFRNEISFTLLNQIKEENVIYRVLKPQPCDLDECGYWIKPEFIDPCLGGWGLRDFVDKTSILGPNADYISDFIRNDRIYVKIKLLNN